MIKNICSLPVYFTVKDEISNSDDRFINVEIDVLHTGLNFNGSIFNKDIVDENIETIKNTPILGFIRSMPDGEDDFKGHEYIITKTDEDKVTRKYIGSAYGLIPESCNPRWITKVCDDGQEREFLQVDGLLWTKFSDSTDILLRDIEKSHSMELYPNNVDGYEDDDGNFVFEKFSFDGCCILGSDIQPAMINSNITIKEVQFSMIDFVKNLQSELNDKYSIFTNLVNEKTNKGGIGTMADTNFAQTLLEQFSDISTMVSQHEEMTDKYGYAYPRYYLADIQEDEAIVVDRNDNYRYYGFKFTMNGDRAEIDFANGNRKKIRYENYEEGNDAPEGSFDFGKHISEIEEIAFSKVNEANEKIAAVEEEKASVQNEYAQIKADYDDIKPKYDEYVRVEEQRQADELNAQKDAKFAEYADMLSDNADFAVLKERKDELSVDEIDKECAVLYVKASRGKTNFSKSSSTSMTVEIMDEHENEGFVVTKYGNIPVRK